MSKSILPLPRLLASLTIASIFIAIAKLARADSVGQIAEYQPSFENFANPERGLFIQYNPEGKSPHPPLKVEELRQHRENNITLIRRIYLISEFKDRPLSPEFLAKVTADLATAREAGVKVILRFSYNWLDGGNDASEETILAQQQQLKPILEANYDVIAMMEAGFIGNWGEWHSSSHNLHQNPLARRKILFNLLSILPKERMVTLRYAHHKRDAFNNDTPLQSFVDPATDRRARVGAMNDCFLASIDDWGTYNSTEVSEVAEQKAYLNQDNLYVVQAGELCNYNPPRTDCPTALAELEQMRWSALNYYLPETDLNVIFQDWSRQECLEEITRRLGYRLSLTRSELNQTAIANGIFELKLDMVNRGWAGFYNPRQLEIIIRHQATGEEYSITSSVNPRRWLPQFPTDDND